MVELREAINFIPEKIWKEYVTTPVVNQITVGKMRRLR